MPLFSINFSHFYPQILVKTLLNLVKNAVEAMQAGGILTVETRTILEAEGGVEIRIVDTGKGIADENLPRIFDPFFSTKGDAGTGLGLSICQGIVENHGGRLTVESIIGVGTTFRIQLPLGPVG